MNYNFAGTGGGGGSGISDLDAEVATEAELIAAIAGGKTQILFTAPFSLTQDIALPTDNFRFKAKTDVYTQINCAGFQFIGDPSTNFTLEDMWFGRSSSSANKPLFAPSSGSFSGVNTLRCGYDNGSTTANNCPFIEHSTVLQRHYDLYLEVPAGGYTQGGLKVNAGAQLQVDGFFGYAANSGSRDLIYMDTGALRSDLRRVEISAAAVTGGSIGFISNAKVSGMTVNGGSNCEVDFSNCDVSGFEITTGGYVYLDSSSGYGNTNLMFFRDANLNGSDLECSVNQPCYPSAA